MPANVVVAMCRKGYASHADEKSVRCPAFVTQNDVLDKIMFQHVPAVQRLPAQTAFVRSFARPTRLDPTRSYKDADGVHGSHTVKGQSRSDSLLLSPYHWTKLFRGVVAIVAVPMRFAVIC